jgi:hypothetical protein
MGVSVRAVCLIGVEPPAQPFSVTRAAASVPTSNIETLQYDCRAGQVKSPRADLLSASNPGLPSYQLVITHN